MITLKLTSYRIDDCMVALINKCITDFPSYTLNDISNTLGINIRTILRYKKRGLLLNYVNKTRS